MWNQDQGQQTQATTPTQQQSYDWYDPNKAYGRVSNGQGGYTGEYTFSHSARDLQAMLNKEFNAGLDVDGYYGAETAKAVQKYLGGAAPQYGNGTVNTNTPPTQSGGQGANATNPIADAATGVTPGNYAPEAVRFDTPVTAKNGRTYTGVSQKARGTGKQSKLQTYLDKVNQKSTDNPWAYDATNVGTVGEEPTTYFSIAPNQGKIGRMMTDLDKQSAENPWAFDATNPYQPESANEEAATRSGDYYYQGRSGNDAYQRELERQQQAQREEEMRRMIAEQNAIYSQDATAMAMDTTIPSQSTPTATQNYGYYYDNRSGNGPAAPEPYSPNTGMSAYKGAELTTRADKTNGLPAGSYQAELKTMQNPPLVVAPNPYRDQNEYGYQYSPYSPYASGQVRTPAKDSSIRYSVPESPSDGFDNTHQIYEVESVPDALMRWYHEDIKTMPVDMILLNAMQAAQSGNKLAADYYNWLAND